jgi:phage major head subunit gpT-like protein
MALKITTALLDTAFTGFSAAFNGAFSGYSPRWAKVAMKVNSGTSENAYPWLKSLKGMREWVGDRVIAQLETDGFRIVNKTYENTIGIPREFFEDDQLGVFGPAIQDLGQTSAEFPDTLVYDLLRNGFSQVCYDGQFFFDTDHPVRDAAGAVQSVSNSGGGAGTPWFLLATNRPIKPVIYQERRAAALARLDRLDDPNVFMKKEFLYGVDMRCAAGYGLWQLAYGSRQTLDAANYAAARAAMMSLKGENGRPLGIVPNLLVVPGSLEGAARSIVLSENNAAGASNPWKGTAELHVEPLLA